MNAIRTLHTQEEHYPEVLAFHIRQLRQHNLPVLLVTLNRPYEEVEELLKEHGVAPDGIVFVDATGQQPPGVQFRPNAFIISSPTELDILRDRIDMALLRMGGEGHIVLDSINLLVDRNLPPASWAFVRDLSFLFKRYQHSADFLIVDGPGAAELKELVAEHVDDEARLRPE